MVINRRRALAAAGAGVLLAGCGAPDEPPSDASLLVESSGAEVELGEAYQRLGGELGAAFAEQAFDHSRRLQELTKGTPGFAAAPTRLSSQPVGGAAARRALEMLRRAMRVHVRTVGLVRDGAHRTVVTDVLTRDAQQLAVLSARLGEEPLASSFPDGREA